jgi:hypothetical protein
MIVMWGRVSDPAAEQSSARSLLADEAEPPGCAR